MIRITWSKAKSEQISLLQPISACILLNIDRNKNLKSDIENTVHLLQMFIIYVWIDSE
jgi:hypothetical protein